MAGARVLLVEDDPSVTLVVSEALRDAGCVVVHAASVRAASAMLPDGFDVAVLDVGLPDGRGFDVLEALRRQDAPCCAVMMTGDPTDATVAHSIAAGVSEFLAKPFRGPDLIDAVGRALEVTRDWRNRIEQARRAGDGGAGGGADGHPRERKSTPQPVAPVAAPSLDPGVERLVAEAGLTDREREILELILAGLQNNDIADALSISANTVKYHVRNMLTKLGLESRTELFRTLLQRRDAD